MSRSVRLLVAAALLLSGCARSPDPLAEVEQARAELISLLWDVTLADGYRYQLTDDRGFPMGPMEVVPLGPDEFVAVYHWSPSTGPAFKVAVATSTNLLDWTWRADLAAYASQPTLKRASDGGFIAAWEQEPVSQTESWIRLAYYDTAADLLAGIPAHTFDAERLLSECAEGTPNIYWGDRTRVEFGFHYYAGCQADRQARGVTDWVTWDAEREDLLDRAVLLQGYDGSIGDRTVLDFQGHRFTFLEASFTLGDWESFRVLVYDEATGAADRELVGAEPIPYPITIPPTEPPSEHVLIRTHHGSSSLSNMSLALVELGGRQALVVTLFILAPGRTGDEGGELIYYRYLDG